MAEAEHSLYWNMYCDVWSYHQKYINNLQNDDNKFWHELVEDGRQIAKKYNYCKFIINLVVNELNVFNEEYKKEKNIDKAV